MLTAVKISRIELLFANRVKTERPLVATYSNLQLQYKLVGLELLVAGRLGPGAPTFLTAGLGGTSGFSAYSAEYERRAAR